MKKKIGLWMLAAVLVFGLLPGMTVSAYETSPDGLVYEPSYASIVDYTGDATDLEVPSRISGHQISQIASRAFEDCTSLVNVTVPEGIEVHESVFSGCTNLKSISFPKDQHTIKAKTFLNCSSLERFEVSEKVSSIDSQAFSGCTALKELTFYGYTSIAKNAFEGVTATVYYSAPQWPKTKLLDYGGDLTWVPINDYEFLMDNANYYLGTGEDYTIPIKAPIDSIDFIMGTTPEEFNFSSAVLDPSCYTLQAVSDTQTLIILKASYLQSLFISEQDSSTSCGIQVYFKDGFFCGWTFNVTKGLPDPSTEDRKFTGSCNENISWRFNPITHTLTISGTGPIPDYEPFATPWNPLDFRYVEIEEGITRIGNNAFFRRLDLEYVTIGHSVQEIGERAMAECRKLTTIFGGNGLKTVADNAYESCGPIDTIPLPELPTEPPTEPPTQEPTNPVTVKPGSENGMIVPILLVIVAVAAVTAVLFLRKRRA